MIDEDFCGFLEYQLSDGLETSTNEQLKGFWCDGILLPIYESEYSKKFVNEPALINCSFKLILFAGCK